MMLERAKQDGLRRLNRTGRLVVKCMVPQFMDGKDAELGRAILGIGYAVAKGWAVYDGGGWFRITDEGRAALAELFDAP